MRTATLKPVEKVSSNIGKTLRRMIGIMGVMGGVGKGVTGRRWGMPSEWVSSLFKRIWR